MQPCNRDLDGIAVEFAKILGSPRAPTSQTWSEIISHHEVPGYILFISDD